MGILIFNVFTSLRVNLFLSDFQNCLFRCGNDEELFFELSNNLTRVRVWAELGGGGGGGEVK